LALVVGDIFIGCDAQHDTEQSAISGAHRPILTPAAGRGFYSARFNPG